MTDTTDDTNDELGFDLSAWEAPEPPADLADAVIARMEGTGVGAVAAVEPRETKRRGLAIAGVAAAVLAAGLGTYAVISKSRPAGSSAGGLVAERARSLALDGVTADLDRGADVWWERRGGVLHVEQRAGAVAWRVDEDSTLVVDAGATVASVEATGANLRVEVSMNSTDARTIGASALTAAVVSLVTVTVYTGHVKVGGQGQPTIVVQPGATHTIVPARAPDPVEPPVVGAAIPDVTLDDVEPAPEPAQPAIQKAPQPPPAPRRMTVGTGTTLDRVAISSTIAAAKPEIQKCGDRSTSSGKIKVKVHVEPGGAVSSAVAEQSFDDKVGACVVKIMRGLQFPATDRGGSFSYPFVFSGGATSATSAASCDAQQLKEQGMQHINMGQHDAALTSFEASLRCKPDPYVLQLTFMEACAARNSPKAKHYYKQLSPSQQTKFAQICIRNRVAYEGDMIVEGDGFLRLRSTPAAKVLIDGKDTGLTTPITGNQLALAPGKHRVTFVVDDDRYTYAVVIKPGETTSLTKVLE